MIKIHLLNDEIYDMKDYLISIKSNDRFTVDNMKNKRLSIDNLFIFEDILEKYSRRIVSFTDSEIREFNFKPKALSKKLYGNIHCFFILLYINKLDHPSRFDISDGINILHKDGLKELVNAIEISESI